MHIYQAKHQRLQIPADTNLTELLHTSATKLLPDQHIIAVDDLEHRAISIGQLCDTAGRLAHGLKSGLAPKDQSRWAILLPNSVAFIEAVHAVLWLDGVFCPINPDLEALEIGYALSVGKVDYAIVWSQIVPKVLKAFCAAKQIHPGFREPRVIVTLGSVDGHLSLHKDFFSSQRLPIPHHQDTRKRLASIHLSSGTTGKPKGVGLSHYNYVSNVRWRGKL
jgi:4-coumarate--CoA ligase